MSVITLVMVCITQLLVWVCVWGLVDLYKDIQKIKKRLGMRE